MNDNDDRVVGTASPAKAIKNRWHKESAEKPVPLKAFAQLLLKEGDSIAKDWFECKKGALNSERSDKNKKRLEEERMATRAAKMKKKA